MTIHDVKVVEALYTTHNQFFDKHPSVQNFTLRFLGKSILFDESSKNWRDRRKAMTPAFYKGKLQGLIEIAKKQVARTMERFESLTELGAVEINIIGEVATMMTDILLSCTIGEECTQVLVDQWEHGTQIKVGLGYALRTTFQSLIHRMSLPHTCLFPSLADKYLTRNERDLAANCTSIRNMVAKVINDRKLSGTKGTDDLVDILMGDPLFNTDNEKTIDEILTIFFAGSQTSANVTQNLILHLCKHPHYKQKLMKELEEPDSELTFYTYCFNEAMRIQPPVFYSSTVRMSQDVVAGGLHIRKHDGICIGMGALCNDPDEW